MALSAEAEKNLNNIANVKCDAKPAHTLEWNMQKVVGLKRRCKSLKEIWKNGDIIIYSLSFQNVSVPSPRYEGDITTTRPLNGWSKLGL